MRGADRSAAWIAAALVAAILAASGASAGAARAGRQKAVQTCQACHGMGGLSKNPEAPNIAGQIENYLVKAITEFRNGERKNETMSIAAKDLTDADIADIAAYYTSIQIEVIPP